MDGKGYESRNASHHSGQLVTVALGRSLETAVVLVLGVDPLAVVAVLQRGHDGAAWLVSVVMWLGRCVFASKLQGTNTALTEKPSGCVVP